GNIFWSFGNNPRNFGLFPGLDERRRGDSKATTWLMRKMPISALLQRSVADHWIFECNLYDHNTRCFTVYVAIGNSILSHRIATYTILVITVSMASVYRG